MWKLRAVVRFNRICSKSPLNTIRCSSSKPIESSHVDPDEQRKFSDAAPEWWDSSSTAGAGLLHALNPVRVGYICEQTSRNNIKSKIASSSKPLSGIRAIDVGCGGGLLSESLARLGAKVVGVDPTVAAVDAARYHGRNDPLTSEIDYRLCTVNDLVLSGETFDLVCSLEVVEHTPDPDEFVYNCAQLVKPGGALVMSTMNRTMKSWGFAILGAEYLGRLLPIGTHDWNKFRTPSELSNAMSRSGLVVKDTSGIVFDPKALGPLTSSRSWKIDPDDIDVNYITFAIKPPLE